MTTIRSGMPGHDDGAAFIRLRRGKPAMGQQASACRTTRPKAPYEIIRPECGRRPEPELVRGLSATTQNPGMCATRDKAEAALMDHIGMATR
jgi:hypothetical protein